jgi:hypothetical protein
MAPIHSSQEFIRALKSASDPPVPEGPFKVQLASQAWQDASFYVPRKAEVIVDWILGKLLKDKSNAPCVTSSSLSIFDITAILQLVKPNFGLPSLASPARRHFDGCCSSVTPYAPFEDMACYFVASYSNCANSCGFP